ncbi:MAG: LemA family protein [Candidatus Aceula lacicola]|nr:LemA family protein [Candidatus Aceula lacicola]
MLVFIIIAVIGVLAFGMYNGLIGKKNDVEKSFGSIDVMLKKRYDLIPNLVAAVKQYMQHEAGTLTEITELRAKAVSGNLSSDEKVSLDNKITKTLGGIMVAVENYPDLKASQNFIQLQGSLNEVEEQISAARRAFNASVTDYNNAVEMFPTNIFASMMNYKRKAVFAVANEQERQNVNIGDAFNN